MINQKTSFLLVKILRKNTHRILHAPKFRTSKKTQEKPIPDPHSQKMKAFDFFVQNKRTKKFSGTLSSPILQRTEVHSLIEV